MNFQEQFNILTAGWTDAELAEKLSISILIARRYKQGKANPAPGMEKLILKILHSQCHEVTNNE